MMDLKPESAGLDHDRRALDKARQRGWRVRMVVGRPQVRAPFDTLSPALVDRLAEHADDVGHILGEPSR